MLKGRKETNFRSNIRGTVICMQMTYIEETADAAFFFGIHDIESFVWSVEFLDGFPSRLSLPSNST